MRLFTLKSAKRDITISLSQSINLIITNNLGFSEWVKLFTDTKMTNALLDRLVYHCYIIETGNESYRFKHQD
nr:hypothetical protein FVA72_08575 [Providencia sp. 1709051003]